MKRSSNGSSFVKRSWIIWSGVMHFCSTASPLYYILSVCSWCVEFVSLFRVKPVLRLHYSQLSLPALDLRVGKLNCGTVDIKRIRLHTDFQLCRMTVPPNSLAALSIWTTVWMSAKYDRRAPFIIGAAAIAIMGMFPQSYFPLGQHP